MATQPQVVQFDQASAAAQQAQPSSWYSRNKSWVVPTGTFAAGVGVGVGVVKTYDWLTSGDEEDAPAAAPTGKTKSAP